MPDSALQERIARLEAGLRQAHSLVTHELAEPFEEGTGTLVAIATVIEDLLSEAPESPEPFEYRCDKSGEFDELFADGAYVHVERMADRAFWIGVERGDQKVMINTGVNAEGDWYFNVEEDSLLPDSKSFSIREAPESPWSFDMKQAPIGEMVLAYYPERVDPVAEDFLSIPDGTWTFGEPIAWMRKPTPPTDAGVQAAKEKR